MEKISFHHYRNSDYIRLVTELLLICKAFAIEVLQAINIAAYYQDILAREAQIGLALDKNHKNPYTKQAAAADQDRDDALDAFKYFLLYCSKQPDATIRQAAERLIIVLQTMGWSMQLESYSEQTKNVRSFIAEVDEHDDLLADIGTCAGTTLFEHIKTTQTAFEEVLSKFNKYETSQKDIDPVAEKAWLRDTINELVDDLNYHCRKQTNAECQQISEQLQTLTESIASELKSRVSRAQADSHA